VISEGSCDTEDWSNDLITGITYSLQYIVTSNCNIFTAFLIK